MTREGTGQPDRPDLSNAEDADLARILDAYLADREAGRAVDPRELLARHPRLAPRIGACLEVMHLADGPLARASIGSASLERTELSITRSHLPLENSRSTIDLVAPGSSQVTLRDLANEREPLLRPQSDAMPREAPERYQLQGEIARGGMGAILRGRDLGLGRELAIKVLLESHQANPQIVQRFVEEAQIGGQLQHPGIVPIYELGALPDQRPFIAMKLVKGQTLAALLAERTRLASGGRQPADGANSANQGTDVRHSPGADRAQGAAGNQGADAPRSPAHDLARFLSIFEAVCQTMAYAHARGVIHRDLKPSNIMVGAFGEVQVMDWGLAKVLAHGGIADEARTGADLASVISTVRSGSSAGGGSESQAGSVLGTPAYMAPEQARGEIDRLDERCDVFGLGAILCEILTGEPPYRASTREGVRAKAARADLHDCHSRLAVCGADPELVALASDCLSGVAEARPRDASAISARLKTHIAKVQERLHSLELARVAADARAAVERRKRKWQLGLTAVVAAFLSAGAGGFALFAVILQGKNDALARANSELDEQRDQARTAVDEMYTQVAEKWLKNRPLLGQVQRDFLAKALAYYEQFVRDPGALPDLGRAYLRVGQIQGAMNRREPALTAFHRAVDIFKKLLQEEPGRPEYRSDLAFSLFGLGNDGRYYGRDWASHRQALAIRRGLVEEFPTNPHYRRALGESYHEFWHGPDPVEAEECLTKSLDIAEALAAEFPEDPDYQQYVGQRLCDLAGMRQGAGRYAEAEHLVSQGADLLRAIVKRYPGRPEYRMVLAWNRMFLGVLLLRAKPSREQRPTAWDHHGLGELFMPCQRCGEAEAALLESDALWQELADNFPDVAVYCDFQAGCRFFLADLFRASGRIDQAHDLYQRIAPVVEREVAEDPSATHLRRNQILLHRGMAEVLRCQGQFDEADTHYRLAVELSRKLEPDFPALARSARQILVQRMTEYGDFLAEAGRGSEAEQVLKEALSREERLAADRSVSALDLEALARLLTSCPVVGLRDPQRAIDAARRASEMDANDERILATLGMAYYRAGAWAESITAFSRSIHLSTVASPDVCLFLAMAHWQTGDRLTARSWYQRANPAGIQRQNQHIRFHQLRAEADSLLGIGDTDIEPRN